MKEYLDKLYIYTQYNLTKELVNHIDSFKNMKIEYPAFIQKKIIETKIEQWRKLLSTGTPDINMKEVEILLRGFAMLIDRDNYKPSMTKFLNGFSYKAKKNSDDENKLLENIFNTFISSLLSLGDKKIFWTNNRFNISVYEAVFATLCESAYKEKDASKVLYADKSRINTLKENKEFINAYSQRTTSKANVQKRNEIAKRILLNNGN